MRGCLLFFILTVNIFNTLVGGQEISSKEKEDKRFSIDASVDREHITVGDPFRFRLIVKSPMNGAIEWTEPDIFVSGFSLLSFDHIGPILASDGSNVDSLYYELTLFETGEYSLPPASLSCILPEGTILSASSVSIPINVVTVLDADANDIRDLKSVVEIPDQIQWYWWVITLIFVLVIGTVVLIYVSYRRKRRDASVVESQQILTPEEIALSELDKLVYNDWLVKGRLKVHYTILSEILRRYLCARYQITAMEFTTNELIRALKKINLETKQIMAIQLLFEECDMVKFAKFNPDSHRQYLSVKEGRAIIEKKVGQASVNEDLQQ